MRKAVFTLLLTFTALCAFAGPEAQYKKLNITYQWLPNGGVEMHYVKVMTYLTHSSFNNFYGETMVFFNPDFQKLTINESYTVQKDGTKIVTPPNAFNEVLPREAVDAPHYNRLTQMVITHTGLELEATAYLDYTITTQPGYYKGLDVDLPLQEIAAIANATLTFIVPQGMQVEQWAGGRPVVKHTTANGQDVYTFSYAKIAPQANERLTPAYDPALPHIVFHAYPQGVAPFDRIRDTFATAEATPELKQLAAGLQTPQEVETYLSTHYAQSPLRLASYGYALRTPQEIHASAYATEAERTLLQYVLLREMGQQPQVYPVYPPSARRVVGSALGLAGVTALTLEEPKEAVPITATETSTIDLGPQDAAKVVYVLPWERSALDVLRTLPSRRLTTLELPAPMDLMHTYQITVQEGLTVLLPKNVRVANALGSFELTFTQEGNQITAVSHLQLPQHIVSVNQYPQLRELVVAFFTPTLRGLILQQ